MDQLLAMRAFVRVIETNSFSKAADQLILPRSSVSKLIHDLEKHLNTKLIHRTTRKLETTSEGLEYYNLATKVIAAVDEADNNIRRIKLKPSGHLRIDAPALFAHNLLIPALPEFHKDYPNIVVSLGITDRTVNIIGDGVDCVIRAGSLQNSSLIARKIIDLQYVTCASFSYLERMGTPINLEDLNKNHAKIGYFFASSGKPEPLKFNLKTESHAIENYQFMVNEGNGLIDMIRAGLGVGQPLKYFVQPYINNGDLISILEEWTRPPLSFYIIYPQNRHQNIRLKVFIDWILNKFNASYEPL